MPKKNILTSHQIVKELDKYIIGQDEAKQIVSTAMRNRWRRMHTDEAIRDEITPSNILMKGPTGTGKSEIGRRMAKICNVPFVKVEATQYTERGYVGDDVKNMVNALADNAVNIVKKKKRKKLKTKLEPIVHEIILDAMVPPIEPGEPEGVTEGEETRLPINQDTRKAFLKKIKSGEIDHRTVDIKIQERPSSIGLISNSMIDDEMLDSLNNFMGRMLPTRTRKRKVTVKEAKKILLEAKLEEHMPIHAIHEEAIKLAQEGIIFIDEIDKISGSSREAGGPEVSRRGVQNNLLPILEGTLVKTKIGFIKTDYILFIAAGAFHHSKPTDLMPELQGRFPLRVELQSLTEEDYVHILRIPANSLINQEKALFSVEGVTLTFTDSSIKAMAKATFTLNVEREDLGARRLRTVVAQVLKDLSFNVPEKITPGSTIVVDKKHVDERLDKLLTERNISEYII